MTPNEMTRYAEYQRTEGKVMSVCWAEYQRADAIWRRAHKDAFAKALEEAAEKVRPLTIIRDRAYVAYNQSRGVGTAKDIVASSLEELAPSPPPWPSFRAIGRRIFKRKK